MPTINLLYTPGQDQGDLTFQAGEKMIVIETLASGWWRGYIDEREGWFPGSYVEVTPSTPTSQDSGFNSVFQMEADGELGIIKSDHVILALQNS